MNQFTHQNVCKVYILIEIVNTEEEYQDYIKSKLTDYKELPDFDEEQHLINLDNKYYFKLFILLSVRNFCCDINLFYNIFIHLSHY